MRSPFVLGSSTKFAEVVRHAEEYAATDYPILLYGETGVGKDILAQHIHSRSSRSTFPFVPVNCGALPAGLFESELFGYQRGAFSGAHVASKGIIRSAGRGTLFLDEVGELDLAPQVKLLRLLDQEEVRPLGGGRVEKCEVRWICATNVDLPRAISEGNFRQDLYERLSVLSIRVPPLRERMEDVPELAKSMFSYLQASFTENVLDELQNYAWPGNIRQLRNLLIRASILGRKVVTAPLLNRILREDEMIHAVMRSRGEEALSGSLKEIEQRAIVDRLRACEGNRKRTAEDLGIAKSTLQEKLRKWKACSNPAAALDTRGLG